MKKKLTVIFFAFVSAVFCRAETEDYSKAEDVKAKIVQDMASRLAGDARRQLEEALSKYPAFNRRDAVDKLHQLIKPPEEAYGEAKRAEVERDAAEKFKVLKPGDMITVTTSLRTYKGTFGGLFKTVKGDAVKVGADTIPRVGIVSSSVDLDLHSGESAKKLAADYFKSHYTDEKKEYARQYEDRLREAVNSAAAAYGAELKSSAAELYSGLLKEWPALTETDIKRNIITPPKGGAEKIRAALQREHEKLLPLKTEKAEAVKNAAVSAAASDTELALCAGGRLTTAAFAPEAERIFDENRASGTPGSAVLRTLTIETDSCKGTGFFMRISGALYAVTNFHVIMGDCIVIRDTRGNFYEHTGIYTPDGGLDLAFLRVSTDDYPLAPFFEPSPAPPSLSIGMPVTAVGNNAGSGVLTCERGKIMGVGPGLIEISSKFVPGASGGPVVAGPDYTPVAVNTYMTRAGGDWTEDSRYAGTRRFAIRIDKIPRLKKIDSRQFGAMLFLLKKLRAARDERESCARKSLNMMKGGAGAGRDYAGLVAEICDGYRKVKGETELDQEDMRRLEALAGIFPKPALEEFKNHTQRLVSMDNFFTMLKPESALYFDTCPDCGGCGYVLNRSFSLSLDSSYIQLCPGCRGDGYVQNSPTLKKRRK
jgi:hypothetical protein